MEMVAAEMGALGEPIGSLQFPCRAAAGTEMEALEEPTASPPYPRRAAVGTERKLVRREELTAQRMGSEEDKGDHRQLLAEVEVGLEVVQVEREVVAAAEKSGRAGRVE